MQRTLSSETTSKVSAAEEPTAIQPSQKPKMILWIILAALAAIILIGWVFWTYQKAINEVEKLALEQKVLELKKQVQKDETADWQTYRNEEYGFEFKYPKNLKVVTDFEYSMFNSGIVDIGPLLFVNIKNEEVRSKARNYFEPYLELAHKNSDSADSGINCVTKEIENNDVQIENVICNGVEIYPIFLAWIEGGIGKELFISGYPILYGQNNNFASESDLLRLLSTFRFLEETEDVSTWQIYRNKKYNFVLKYPNGWTIKEDFLADERFLALKDDWVLFFDTGIDDKSGQDILIHLFIGDANSFHSRNLCEQNIACQYDNPIYHNNSISIYDSKHAVYDWFIGNENNLITVGKIFDLDEGMGYVDRIGIELRNSLDKETLQVIKTIEFIN